MPTVQTPSEDSGPPTEAKEQLLAAAINLREHIPHDRDNSRSPKESSKARASSNKSGESYKPVTPNKSSNRMPSPIDLRGPSEMTSGSGTPSSAYVQHKLVHCETVQDPVAVGAVKRGRRRIEDGYEALDTLGRALREGSDIVSYRCIARAIHHVHG